MAKQLDARPRTISRNYSDDNDENPIVDVIAQGCWRDPVESPEEQELHFFDATVTYDNTNAVSQVETDIEAALKTAAGIP